ncbi:hypothetical protein [uncultured Cloacibacillus sp.]|uniref:lipopolysaccharide biosynthesis protein n=1 Tax=uncultured Cloacibacillus sp. TaxID=889794 RepID=UPI00320BB03D
MKFATVGQILGILIGFVSRKVFVMCLSAEYLGLNGLFSNILSMLALAELGVGSAIVYSLYKPIAQENTEEIKSLMRLYKQIYTAVGVFILIAGSALTPFLHLFIRELPNIPNIRQIYFIYVVNSAISYFFTYKRSIIIANQKWYVVTMYHYSLYFCMNVAQMFVLWLTRDFILFLLIQTASTFAENVLLSRKADSLYAYLRDKVIQPLSLDVKNEIKKNVFAMIFHKIGSVVVFSTDNILISKLVGLTAVGIYSNYMLIRVGVNTITSIVFQSVSASFGNLNALASDEKKIEVFQIINFAGAWIFGFCSICFFVLVNPFISLWLGDEYLFPITTVFLFVTSFYLTGMRQACLTVRDVMGLFWYDRYKPVLEVLINLIVSVILGQIWGVNGILAGTVISTLTTCFWIEPYVLYKYGFHCPMSEYFVKYSMYFTATFLAAIITTLICNIIPDYGIKAFFGKLVVCGVMPNLIFIGCYRNTLEFKYIISVIRMLLSR